LPQLWLCALFPLFGNTFSFSRLQWLLLVLPFFHPLMMRATGRGWLCLACFFPLLCLCHPPRGLPVSLIHLLLSVLLYPGIRRSLFWHSTSARAGRFCLGSVGMTKFCIKDCLPATKSCGTGRHATSKFNGIPGGFFIKHNELHAFCQPTLVAPQLTDRQVAAILKKNATCA